MELKIAKALEPRRLKHEIDYLRHTQEDIYDFNRIVGASGALQRVLDVVRKVAKSTTTCLIRGETGTGKELIAGAIHHNSPRASRNFVRVNCAALQENLLESELFGHEKGAFTGADRQRVGRFEQADGGSLFLEEVGDMSPNTQAKILRVLQEHEFERLGGTRTLQCDVRVIAATNRSLPDMVTQGLFREDLYYRLNVVSVDMPPLRERKDDILELAHFFLRRFAGELRKRVDGLQPAAEKLLKRHNWPGNIRELENAIERAVLLTEGPQLGQDDLRLGELTMGASAQEHPTAVKIPPTGIPPRGNRATSRRRSAEHVELGAEGRRRATVDQPARDELQDQDARDRATAGSARHADEVGPDRRLLRPRVSPAIDLGNLGRTHMRVALRRGDASVPQQLLDRSQIRATFQQVRRKRVAQGVRADAQPGARLRHVAADDSIDATPGEPAAAVVDKERIVPSRARSRGGG